jgi:hypothetical protein
MNRGKVNRGKPSITTIDRVPLKTRNFFANIRNISFLKDHLHWMALEQSQEYHQRASGIYALLGLTFFSLFSRIGLLVVALCSTGYAQERYLDWTDNSGNFRVHAKFERIEAGYVVLIRDDGKEIKVAKNRLSDESQKQAEIEESYYNDLSKSSKKMTKTENDSSEKGDSDLGVSKDSRDQLDSKQDKPVKPIPEKKPPKKITNWITPDRIIDQLGELSVEQNKYPLLHSFRVLQKIKDDLYEVIIDGPREVAGRAIIRTTLTTYKSTGSGSLPLVLKGETELELENGFSQKFKLFEESKDFTSEQVVQKGFETDKLSSALVYPLVYSCLAWNTDWYGPYDSNDYNLGFYTWKERLATESQYHPRRFLFSFEVLSNAKRIYNQAVERNFTAAHLAADRLDTDTLRKLAAANADLGDRGLCDHAPVIIAFQSYLKTTRFERGYLEVGKFDTRPAEIVFSTDYLRTLLNIFEQNGASLLESTSDGQNMVHLVAQYASDTKKIERIEETLRLLKEKKIDGNAKDKDGFTPLHLFVVNEVMQGKRKKTKLYMEGFGGKTSQIEKDSESRLARIIDCLIESGGDINAQDQFGNTILHIAVGYGRVDLATVIINKKAKKGIRNKNNMSSYDLFTRAYPKLMNGRLPDWNQMLNLLK